MVNIMAISSFLKAFYKPNEVIDDIKAKTSMVGKTLAKVMIGITLTSLTALLAFIGIILMEMYFLIIDKISFSLELIILPFYAAMIIPIVFWLLDTVILIIIVELMREKINLIGVLNIRALSIVPMPLKILYFYYLYASINLKQLLLPSTNFISLLITIWSIILLIRSVRKVFNLPYFKAVIAGISPFIIKAIIAITLI